MEKDRLRIAAVGDLHCHKDSQGVFQPFLARVNEVADCLLLLGDLTDYGHPEEAHVLARELTASVKVPILAVLGNHDYESGHEVEVKRILTEAGVKILDGDVYEICGVGFAGVKGFCGGFDRASLQPWGEATIKRFVHEAVEEALKLESALAKLRTEKRIVLLHYSPIRQTVEGEPLDIYTFLGSSRLEDPLNRYPVDAVFHGHAHHGAPQGFTKTGTPVYNVALPLMRKLFPERPFRVYEILKEAPCPSPTIPSTAFITTSSSS